MRLSDTFVDLMTPEEREIGKYYVEGGFPINLTEMPALVRKANYKSYDHEYAEKSMDDLQRHLDAGWLEGPLLYNPWIISSQGGVWNEDKQKYRPILDCTASGLNPLIVPPDCHYDLLEDTLLAVRIVE